MLPGGAGIRFSRDLFVRDPVHPCVTAWNCPALVGGKLILCATRAVSH